MNIVDIMSAYAIPSIIIIGMMVTTISTLLLRAFTDQDKLKGLKAQQKELQKKVKECQKKGDFCQLEKLNKEAMDVSMSVMKSSFSGKQFLITFVPFILLFSWLRELYVPILGTKWLWIYFASAMGSSILLRKWLKMA